MGNSVSVAVPVLCVAISALELAILLDPQRTPSGTQQAPPPLRGAIWAFLPLPAVGALFASVALVYLHFYRAAAATAAGHRRLPELVVFMLCASVAFLHFFLFVQEAPAPGGVDYGHEAARELGLAALRALPAAATASFFLGMMLIIVGHIRAGGEGGGGAVAVAGHGPIEAPVVGILVKVASAMAAALVLLMGMAVLFS